MKTIHGLMAGGIDTDMEKKSVFELMSEERWKENHDIIFLGARTGVGVPLNISEERTLKSISMAEEIHCSSQPFKPVDISCNLGSLPMKSLMVDSEDSMMKAYQSGIRSLNTVCTELNPMEKPKNFKELMEASRKISAMYREHVGKMKGVKA